MAKYFLASLFETLVSFRLMSKSDSTAHTRSTDFFKRKFDFSKNSMRTFDDMAIDVVLFKFVLVNCRGFFR